jgi:hypothetical protein
MATHNNRRRLDRDERRLRSNDERMTLLYQSDQGHVVALRTCFELLLMGRAAVPKRAPAADLRVGFPGHDAMEVLIALTASGDLAPSELSELLDRSLKSIGSSIKRLSRFGYIVVRTAMRGRARDHTIACVTLEGTKYALRFGLETVPESQRVVNEILDRDNSAHRDETVYRAPQPAGRLTCRRAAPSERGHRVGDALGDP